MGKRWVDNSPENLLIATELAALFPSAVFVHIVRDGRAVVNSMLHSGFAEPFAKDFDEACRTWAHYLKTGFDTQLVLRERMCTVLQKWILDDPVKTCSALLAFLGEDDHPGPSSFLRTKRINSSYDSRSQEEMKEPKDPAKLRDKVWERWERERIQRFEDLAGEAMDILEAFEAAARLVGVGCFAFARGKDDG